MSLTPNDLEWYGDRYATVVDNIEHVIQGKRSTIELVVTSLVAEGHVLIEDVPGVGKTLLAKSLARSIDCSFQRIQFTPDLLPADITGVSVWNRETSSFSFRAGPVFANVVLGDEINRASPKLSQRSLRQWRNSRSPLMARHTYWTPRSSSLQHRTQSSTRGRIRFPKRSSIDS